MNHDFTLIQNNKDLKFCNFKNCVVLLSLHIKGMYKVFLVD